MAWEIAFSVAFLTVAGVFAMFALKAGETLDPLTKEVTRGGKIFRWLFAMLTLYCLVLGLGGAQFAAEGSDVSQNTTTVNTIQNYTSSSIQYLCSNGTYYPSNSTCSGTGAVLSSITTTSVQPLVTSFNTTSATLESNTKASALATSGFGIVLNVIYLMTAFFLIGFIWEFFQWLNEWREETFRTKTKGR